MAKNDEGFEVVIKGFKTKKQAQAFVEWYEGAGEQDACQWFDARVQQGELDVRSMLTDIDNTYPLKWKGNVLPMTIKVAK